MSGLVAIAYPDLATADAVRQELIRAAEEGLAQLDDAVVVERTLDGDVKLHQVRSSAAGGARAGAAGGALGSKLADEGIDNVFMEDLGDRLRPGAAALIALGSTEQREVLIERVKRYRGVVLQSSLSPADHEHLREALS